MSPRPLAAEAIDWSRVRNVLGLLAVLAVVGVFVAIAVPQVVGADRSFVVRSDSMSPAIGAGSVVFVDEAPASAISTGDVVTYRDRSSRSERVTHRVVEVVESNGERRFRTKGDANEEPDSTPIDSGAVIGRVSFHVPFAGYVVTFAQTDLGLLSLVVLPATLLAITELRDLARAAREEDTDGSSSGENT